MSNPEDEITAWFAERSKLSAVDLNKSTGLEDSSIQVLKKWFMHIKTPVTNQKVINEISLQIWNGILNLQD